MSKIGVLSASPALLSSPHRSATGHLTCAAPQNVLGHRRHVGSDSAARNWTSRVDPSRSGRRLRRPAAGLRPCAGHRVPRPSQEALSISSDRVGGQMASQLRRRRPSQAPLARARPLQPLAGLTARCSRRIAMRGRGSAMVLRPALDFGSESNTPPPNLSGQSQPRFAQLAGSMQPCFHTTRRSCVMTLSVPFRDRCPAIAIPVLRLGEVRATAR